MDNDKFRNVYLCVQISNPLPSPTTCKSAGESGASTPVTTSQLLQVARRDIINHKSNHRKERSAIDSIYS